MRTFNLLKNLNVGLTALVIAVTATAAVVEYNNDRLPKPLTTIQNLTLETLPAEAKPLEGKARLLKIIREHPQYKTLPKPEVVKRNLESALNKLDYNEVIQAYCKADRRCQNVGLSYAEDGKRVMSTELINYKAKQIMISGSYMGMNEEIVKIAVCQFLNSVNTAVVDAAQSI